MSFIPSVNSPSKNVDRGFAAEREKTSAWIDALFSAEVMSLGVNVILFSFLGFTCTSTDVPSSFSRQHLAIVWKENNIIR